MKLAKELTFIVTIVTMLLINFCLGKIPIDSEQNSVLITLFFLITVNWIINTTITDKIIYQSSTIIIWLTFGYVIIYSYICTI
jgi:hypothetical protein